MVHTSVRKKEQETDHFHRTNMQREIVMQRLREQGFRITRQRRILLDVILNEDCACCKEIYYKASSIDEGIGAATVYRMVNLLEEIGAIDRKSMYRISCGERCENCAVSPTLPKAEHHECEFCGNELNYQEIIEYITCARDAILNKAGKLTDEESESIKKFLVDFLEILK